MQGLCHLHHRHGAAALAGHWLQQYRHADLVAAESWRPQPGPRWAGPTWIVNGDRDHALDPGKVEDWRHSVDGPLELQRLPGGHFYLFDAKSGFLTTLLARLRALP